MNVASQWTRPQFRGMLKHSIQRRFLNLHEYQAKSLLDKYGVATQQFRVVDNASDAKKAALDLGKRFNDSLALTNNLSSSRRPRIRCQGPNSCRWPW